MMLIGSGINMQGFMQACAPLLYNFHGFNKSIKNLLTIIITLI